MESPFLYYENEIKELKEKIQKLEEENRKLKENGASISSLIEKFPAYQYECSTDYKDGSFSER